MMVAATNIADRGLFVTLPLSISGAGTLTACGRRRNNVLIAIEGSRQISFGIVCTWDSILGTYAVNCEEIIPAFGVQYIVISDFVESRDGAGTVLRNVRRGFCGFFYSIVTQANGNDVRCNSGSIGNSGALPVARR